MGNTLGDFGEVRMARCGWASWALSRCGALLGRGSPSLPVPFQLSGGLRYPAEAASVGLPSENQKQLGSEGLCLPPAGFLPA